MPISCARRHLLALGLASAAVPAHAAPSGIERLLAPAARLWPRWQAHNALSPQTVDHTLWTKLLARLVRPQPDGSTRLAYAAAGAAEHAAIAAYLAANAAVPVSTLARPEQFAFWANTYNALIVKIVLDAWPVRSIRDISLSSGLFASGPWDAPLITLEGENLTLNDIEHRILRPIWGDPRVHYAVNCASIGCPDLRSQALTGAGLDATLDAAAAAYVNHPRGVAVTADGLVLSSIYNWFAEDFGAANGVTVHLRRHALPALVPQLQPDVRIAGYHYDWSINAAER